VVANLPLDIISEVRDIITNLSQTDTPYEQLKEALLQRTTSSERTRLQQLLSLEELGDRRPTQLLRHMHHLLGSHAKTFDSGLLTELFLQRMPPQVQQVLTVIRDTSTTEQLAETADKLMEINPSPTSSNVAVNSVSSEVADLKLQVQRLTDSVDKLLKTRSRSATPKPPGFRRERRDRRDKSPAEASLCHYHRRFGTRAHKCVKPCTFKSTLNDGGEF